MLLNKGLLFTVSSAVMFFNSVTFALAGNDMSPLKHKPVPVEVLSVHYQQQAKSIVSSGTVRPVSEQVLAFKVAGVVDKVLVTEGTQVTKGQPLARLQLDEIDAQVAKATAVLTDAKRQLKRINELKQQQLASDEQAKQAQTRVDVAQSDLTIAKFNRQYAVISAPSDGRVLTRLIEPHELVQSGQRGFVFADDTKGWNVRLAVADVDVVKLQLGDRATIALDAYPQKQFIGRVREIAGRANGLSQTFEVDIEFVQNPKLYSGLIAHTKITPATKQRLAAIPLTAFLRADDHRAQVYVLNQQAQPVLKEIDFAYLDQGFAYVYQGLNEGEKVVIQGGEFIIAERPIIVVNDEGIAHSHLARQ